MAFHLHLDSETIEQVRPEEPVCVEKSATVRTVLTLMKDSGKDGVLICEDQKLLGVFTERDALRLMALGDNFETLVSEVMVRDPETISISDTVKSAIQKMAEGGYRRLPVIDAGGQAVGMLKVSMILHYLVQHFPQQVYNLPPKPHHKTQTREGA